MIRTNLIRGITDALWGYYPTLKIGFNRMIIDIDFYRRVLAGASFGTMIGGVAYDKSEFAILGAILYGAIRVLPYIYSYREHWRFKE